MFPKPPEFCKANGTYGLGVLTADFDNDGWPDIYVANDSTASALYQNKKNGKFVDIAIEAGCALSPDGKPQAGMGVSAADYDLDGNLDIVKTNFAGDTPSLYHNLGGGNFEDTTFTAGLGAHTQYLGWGCGFFDMDNDGWPDILICNGHVYPEVEQLKTEAGYPQRKLLYRNLRNGHFEDVSLQAGPGISEPSASRGAPSAISTTTATSTSWSTPSTIFRSCCAAIRGSGNNWIKVRTIGTKSNRSGIGARLRCVTQAAGEANRIARSTKSAAAAAIFRRTICACTLAWAKRKRSSCSKSAGPAAQVDTLKDVKPNQLIFVKEGEGIMRTMQFAEKETKEITTEATENVLKPSVLLCVVCGSRFGGLRSYGRPLALGQSRNLVDLQIGKSLHQPARPANLNPLDFVALAQAEVNSHVAV